MNYARAKRYADDLIPVIDISPLRDGSDPVAVGEALHAASTGLGFIYIKGHGIADEAIEAARETALAFFRSDPSLKDSVKISARHRGWLAQGGAKMQDDAKSDLKESFIWGYQDTEGCVPEDHALRGPNLWPDFLPGMQASAMAYFDGAHDVAHHLMRGFALGLGLEQDFFLRSCAQPLSRASFVYYPPQSEDMGSEQFGVGPHTDFGVLTVLCQDSVGGLQVQDVNGDWIEAPPIEGTLIVNVGDLLARWTDHAYNSTPHRVVNSSGKERLSLVLAFDPDPETMIDAREIYGREHQAKEEPTTCGDYLVWRFAKAFSYRKA
ncbi:isopenicillin N synthase family oxygenase [Pelagibius sp. Alg239-R121]|uniref:isopenicillin N synthase family dioxygenase n=1 Tax=Pelagibius sp. Alg239-R121 TaxID=2993448 RepID=UPI0024A674F0|nr:2OG-Fe(II) oxygenase family protein [Pelagibius sp. Alg239-R121]